jgi:hypothetical protein
MEERGALAGIIRHPGFEAAKKLAVSVVEQFRVDLDNANPADTKEVIAKHALSRAAGVFYTRWMQRVHDAVERAETIPDSPANAVDPTEGVLQMDELSALTGNLPNFFGDVIMEEEQ